MRHFTQLYKNPGRLIDYIFIKYFHKKLASLKPMEIYFVGKTGLEIGGPSPIFTANGYFPVYPLADQVDGCNFSTNTVWENKIEEGLTYNFGGNKKGRQFIHDATDLNTIPDNSYDFILSSHSLEHLANPIKGLREWIRVLKTGGAIVVIVPDSNYTFDNKRPVTMFEHLIDDYNNNTKEDDLTHLNEILSLHDLSSDPGVGGFENLKTRCADNIDNRCMHHHVFDLALLKQIFRYFELQTVLTDISPPFNIIIAGIKK